MAINPLWLYGGAKVAGGLYGYLKPDRQRQIQTEVLEDMRSQRARWMRMARGQFSGRERQDIARAAEPGLNRLAGNLAQRGIGTSGAGGQLLAQASVRPYTDARMAAEGQVQNVNQGILQAASMFPSDDSFFDDLGGAVQLYQEYQGLQGMGEMFGAGTGASEDGIFNDMLQRLMGYSKELQNILSGGGE